MITLHFYLLQYKYELFHINFTSSHCTGRYELNKFTSLPTCGFIVQLVEHRTGGHGFESRWSPDFFFSLLLSNCLNWKIYCDDHSSLPLLRENWAMYFIIKFRQPTDTGCYVLYVGCLPTHRTSDCCREEAFIFLKLSRNFGSMVRPIVRIKKQPIRNPVIWRAQSSQSAAVL